MARSVRLRGLIAPTFREFFHRVIATEYHPPLYFLISDAWVRLAGTSELSLKTIPFVCSVLTILAVYRLGALAGSSAVGLLAAAMYAVSPLAILESGDYLYPLMGLLCTVLAALVMKGRREPLRPARLAAIAGVSILATYTHYAALFYVPFWPHGRCALPGDCATARHWRLRCCSERCRSCCGCRTS